MTTKEAIIEAIKVIIKEYGNFSTADIQAETSPMVNSIGKDHFILAERFSINGADTVTYIHENNVDEGYFPYENLDESTLEDILMLAQNWEADCLKTEKRCQN